MFGLDPLGSVSLAALAAASALQSAEPDFVLDLPVSVNGTYRRALSVGVVGTEDILLRQSDVLDLIDEVVTDDYRASLGLERDDELVSGEALAAAGLDVSFDSAALSVEIVVPPEGRRPVGIAVRPRAGGAPGGNDLEPAGLAAGLVLAVRPTVLHAGGQTGLLPLSAQARGFVSVGGFDGVKLAYRGSFREGAAEPFTLRDAVVFRDDFERAVRYAAGTIDPTVTTRFSTTPGLLGVGVFRDYIGIRPFENFRPTGATRFTLERTALVTIDVNGAPVLSRQFDAGTYDLSDLPLSIGGNDVTITVEEDGAPIELATLSPYLDNDLLGRGRSRFAFVGGGVAERGGAVPRAGDRAAIAFYERGLTDGLTLGASAEALGKSWQLAGRAVVGTPVGLFAAEAALQRQPEGGSGLAGALRYTLQTDPTRNVNHRVDLQARATEAGFGRLRPDVLGGDPFAADPETYDLSLRYSGRFGRLNTFGNGQWLRRGRRETASASAGFAVALGRFNLNVTGRAEWASDPLAGEQTEEALLFALTAPLGSRARLRTSYDTDGRTSIARLQKIGGAAVGEWDARATVSDDEAGGGIDLAASVNANRALLGLSHTSQRADGRERSQTQAQVEVGIGYAGGKVGWGRPFQDGFVVVAPHSSLGDRQVSLRRPDGALEARSGALGPALQPLRQAYRNDQVRIEVPDLPVGYDIGPPTLEVFPSELSGYAYTVGDGASNTVMGRLIRPDGAPMALAVGFVRQVGSAPGEEEASFFTNRTGRFVAEGLRSGRYEVRLKPDDRVVGTVEIPEDAEGLVRLGEVRMEVP